MCILFSAFLILKLLNSINCQENQYLNYVPKCEYAKGFNTSQHTIEIPSVLMTSGNKTRFRLIELRLVCPSILRKLPFPIVFEEDENGEIPEPEIKFEFDGVLKYDLGHYWKSEYCLEGLTQTEAVISICNISCSDPLSGKICVPKCCGWGKVLHFVNESNVTCHPAEDTKVNWKPALYSSNNISYCLESRDQSPYCLQHGIPEEIYHYQNTFPGCEFDPIAYDDTPFAFTRDGSLRVDELKWKNSEYCIDGLYGQDPEIIIQGRAHGAMVCLCEEDEYSEERERIHVVYVVVMFISAFFLLLTVIVYILIWDKQNIHGWTVFSLSVSMGLMLVFLGTARLIVMTQGRENVTGSGPCIFVGITAHFLFLSTFSLLTCLSFDLWWTFRTLAPSIGKSKGVLRFRMYLLFSLAFPLIIVSIGFMLDKLYGHLPKHERGIIIPEYGIDTCYIADKVSQGVYIFLPVALLLLANLMFFLTTMWIMYRYHQNTKTARKNSVKQKQTLYLFTKLFVVMGVTWTVEVIEYLSDYNRVEKDEKQCTIYHAPGYKWMVTDFFNIIQGILIFLIFVCKKTVMIHLSRKNSTLRAIVAPIFHLPCCKLNQMDFEAPSGRTNQSSVSMRTFTPRNAELSSGS